MIPKTENLLAKKNELLSSLTRCMTQYIEEESPDNTFNLLLSEVLRLTNSEYGFIGDVYYDENNQPFLKTRSITDISWDKSSMDFYKKHAPQGMVFVNLNSLFGAVLVTKKPVVSNKPSSDPRRCGLPQGHPALNAFLGLPFLDGEKLIGMLGIANRKEGYNEEIIDYLVPFNKVCATLIKSYGHIDKKTKAEEALSMSEDRFKTLAYSAPVGVFLADVSGQCTFVNEKWTEITGINKEKALGNGWMEGIFPEDRNKVLEEWATSIKANRPFQLEYRFQDKTGHINWVLGQTHKMTTAPVSYVGTITDISPIKKLESELKNAKYTAESASSAKSQFLANISHEIRTPLTAIKGFTDLMLEKDILSEEKAREYQEIIQRNSEKLLTIVDDLLDLSKVEADKLNIEIYPFHLKEELKDIFSYFRKECNEKDLNFDCQIDAQVPEEIKTAPIRVRQILTNLLSNSLKFTESGQIKLSIFVNSKQELVFEVTDTGVGMSSEEKKRLFKMFSQGDPSHTRQYGGSGLGLYLSKKLATTLGGNIHLISSEINKGSCFQFYLPEDTYKLSAQSSKVSTSSEPDISPKSLNGLSILLVEDGADNQALFLEVLRDGGAQVDLAETGVEALERCQETNYSVVLMDIQIPNIDGLEVTRRLKERGYKSPIIALTAHAMTSDKDRCLEAGCVDYISKPVSPKYFIEKIKLNL